MKTILIFVSCLAITSLVFAENPNDPNQKKKKGKGNAETAVVNQGGNGQNKAGGGGGNGHGRNFGKGKGLNNGTNLNTTNNNNGGVKVHRKTNKVTDVNGTTANTTTNVNTANGGGKNHLKKNKAGNAATTVNTGATGNTGVVNAANNKGDKFVKGGGKFVKAKNGTVHAKFAIKKLQLVSGPKPNIASVQFHPGYRIKNSQNWSGPRYVVFRNYNPVWHDRVWWQGRYGSDIVLISGGYYYRTGGYWYPAWGYDQSAAYYPYDGPIYAYNNLPPDQVIANVQSALQQLGYYQSGEVDGLLGPMTRDAIAQYQNDNGLAPTETVDEPTLASLGIS